MSYCPTAPQEQANPTRGAETSQQISVGRVVAAMHLVLATRRAARVEAQAAESRRAA